MENESRKGKEIVGIIQVDDEDETFRNCKSGRKTCKIKYWNYKEWTQKTNEIVENPQNVKKKRVLVEPKECKTQEFSHFSYDRLM